VPDPVDRSYAGFWIWTSENSTLPRTPVNKGKNKGRDY
jgi:hypothetical protein